MPETINSQGYCLYCNQLFTQKEIGKHLASHLAGKEKSDKGKKTDTYCHIKVEAGDMFLHLLVKGDKSMKIIGN